MSVQLTTRQALLLDGVAQGLPIARAGELAGYRSRQNSHDAFVDTRDRLLETMDKVGLTEWDILARIREMVDANKVIAHGMALVDVPDNGARLKAIEIAANIRGIVKRDDRPSIGTVNIVWAGLQPDWQRVPEDKRTIEGNEINAKVNARESIHISTIEGTDPEGGPSTHMRSQGSSDPPVLTQRIIKKRGPRLPVYKGRKK